MTCRTRLDAGHGRCHIRRSRSGRSCAPSASPHHASPGPADLVTRVAAIIPIPGDALCADDHAWEAFSAFLDETAQLVTDVLGHAGIRALRALLYSSPGEDVVTRLLIERALTRLQDGDY